MAVLMTLLSDILDPRALEALVTDGFISRKPHPNAPLSIYDYTQRAQFERVWTPETLACRGLIVHDDGRIWARPFPKFFNSGEHESLPTNESFEVFDKLDGSLGITYRHPHTGEWHVSTRGSFVSEQAIHATEIARAKYADALDRFATDEHTWLFEIIYPTNRIVVDYAGLDDLVLLAIIDKATGNDRDLPDQAQWPGRIVTRHHTLQLWSQVAEADGEHRLGEDGEGYVVRFASGLRVKVKFADYVRLHRIVTGISTVTVWEHLSESRPFGELVDRVPDELFAWLTSYAEELRANFVSIESECRAVMTDPRVQPQDRKATALFFADHPNRAVLFKMLDAKPYDSLIWRLLKPTFAKPFKVAEPG
jgi:RNA ligase